MRMTMGLTRLPQSSCASVPPWFVATLTAGIAVVVVTVGKVC